MKSGAPDGSTVAAPLVFFWPLCCLFFIELRILITLLVSSNSSEENNLICIIFKLTGKSFYKYHAEFSFAQEIREIRGL
jgi:hypothetical protein